MYLSFYIFLAVKLSVAHDDLFLFPRLLLFTSFTVIYESNFTRSHIYPVKITGRDDSVFELSTFFTCWEHLLFDNSFCSQKLDFLFDKRNWEQRPLCYSSQLISHLPLVELRTEEKYI